MDAILVDFRNSYAKYILASYIHVFFIHGCHIEAVSIFIIAVSCFKVNREK